MSPTCKIDLPNKLRPFSCEGQMQSAICARHSLAGKFTGEEPVDATVVLGLRESITYSCSKGCFQFMKGLLSAYERAAFRSEKHCFFKIREG